MLIFVPKLVIKKARRFFAQKRPRTVKNLKAL